MTYEHLLVEIGDDFVGEITLNRPEQLNAFNTPLAGELVQALKELDAQTTVRVILLKGAGKAFCAGGDVQALHASAVETPGGPCEYAETFFTREYRMNYTLHTYPKPLVCWGHGIVMGGGLGRERRQAENRQGDQAGSNGGHRFLLELNVIRMHPYSRPWRPVLYCTGRPPAQGEAAGHIAAIPTGREFTRGQDCSLKPHPSGAHRPRDTWRRWPG